MRGADERGCDSTPFNPLITRIVLAKILAYL